MTTTWRPEIENWTSDREAAALVALVRGAQPDRPRVLEVGTFKGFAAVLMATEGAIVHAVDWHRGDADLGERDTLCAWWTNVRRNGCADCVIGHVGRSEDILPLLRSHVFDLAFIDGYHAYEAVTRDIVLTVPLVRPGGVLAFHDYSSSWPGVVRAVDELVGKPHDLIDSLAIVEVKT